MKTLSLALLLGGFAAAGIAAPAQAAGCISGAVVGGVVGHVAGHHGLLGAAAGCAVGHHRAAVQRRERYDNSRDVRTGPDRDRYGRDAYRDDVPR